MLLAALTDHPGAPTALLVALADAATDTTPNRVLTSLAVHPNLPQSHPLLTGEHPGPVVMAHDPRLSPARQALLARTTPVMTLAWQLQDTGSTCPPALARLARAAFDHRHKRSGPLRMVVAHPDVPDALAVPVLAVQLRESRPDQAVPALIGASLRPAHLRSLAGVADGDCRSLLQAAAAAGDPNQHMVQALTRLAYQDPSMWPDLLAATGSAGVAEAMAAHRSTVLDRILAGHLRVQPNARVRALHRLAQSGADRIGDDLIRLARHLSDQDVVDLTATTREAWSHLLTNPALTPATVSEVWRRAHPSSGARGALTAPRSVMALSHAVIAHPATPAPVRAQALAVSADLAGRADADGVLWGPLVRMHRCLEATLGRRARPVTAIGLPLLDGGWSALSPAQAHLSARLRTELTPVLTHLDNPARARVFAQLVSTFAGSLDELMDVCATTTA